MSRFARMNSAKEVTTSDISGARMTIPPGVIYRGERMTKMEYEQRRKRDFGNEVLSPYLAQLEQDLEDILDVGENAGT